MGILHRIFTGWRTPNVTGTFATQSHLNEITKAFYDRKLAEKLAIRPGSIIGFDRFDPAMNRPLLAMFVTADGAVKFQEMALQEGQSLPPHFDFGCVGRLAVAAASDPLEMVTMKTVTRRYVLSNHSGNVVEYREEI